MNDFIVNLAAGVALSVLSWFVVRVVSPLYLAWRHKAPDLSGQWSFFDGANDEASAVGAAVIRQRGERLTAEVTRTKSRSGKPLSRSFTYRGRVRDGQLLLAFEEPVSNGFIAGQVVLKVSGDLKRLTGYTVYLDRDSGSVAAHPIDFRRT
jgi:hypothetical protein